jgi:uncharacterized protein YjgD (DUF1641 family)
VTAPTTPAPSEIMGRLEALTAEMEVLVGALAEERSRRAATDDAMAPHGAVPTRWSVEGLDGTATDPGAVTDLLVLLAESAPTLGRSLRALRAIDELAGDVGQLSGDVVEQLIARLDDLERRGYVEFAAGVFEIIDRVVTSFGKEDLKLLGDNVVLILETVKEMTQPQVMHRVQRAARIVREEHDPGEVSTFRLLRELRDPEVRLGFHRMLAVVRGMAGGIEPVREESDE